MWKTVILCTEKSSPDTWNSVMDHVMARSRGKANTGNIVVSICYKSPGQEDKTDEAFSH